MHSTYIHTSEFETVDISIYENVVKFKSCSSKFDYKLTNETYLNVI